MSYLDNSDDNDPDVYDNDFAELSPFKTHIFISYRDLETSEDKKNLFKIFKIEEKEYRDSNKCGLLHTFRNTKDIDWNKLLSPLFLRRWCSFSAALIHRKINFIVLTEDHYLSRAQIFYPSNKKFYEREGKFFALERVFSGHSASPFLYVILGGVPCKYHSRYGYFHKGFLESLASLFLFNPKFIGFMDNKYGAHTTDWEENDWLHTLDKLSQSHDDSKGVLISVRNGINWLSAKEIKEKISDPSNQKSKIIKRFFSFPVIAYPDTNTRHIYFSIIRNSDYNAMQHEDYVTIFAFLGE